MGPSGELDAVGQGAVPGGRAVPGPGEGSRPACEHRPRPTRPRRSCAAPAHPVLPLREASPRQDLPVLVEELDVVMVLSPVITVEQHPADRRTPVVGCERSCHVPGNRSGRWSHAVGTDPRDRCRHRVPPGCPERREFPCQLSSSPQLRHRRRTGSRRVGPQLPKCSARSALIGSTSVASTRGPLTIVGRTSVRPGLVEGLGGKLSLRLPTRSTGVAHCRLAFPPGTME